MPPASTDIIVESRSQGQNASSYSELEGNWIDSQNPPGVTKSSAPGSTPGTQCGTRKVLFRANDEPDKKPAPAAARFHPQVSAPERLHTYITWPTSANAAPVRITIKHRGGEELPELSQQGRSDSGGGNANKWVSLGAYDFIPGEDQYVEMRVDSNVHSATMSFRGQLVADAVRFRSGPLETGTLPLEQAKSRVPEFPWRTSLDGAMKEAAQRNRKILLSFALPGSNVSRHLEEIVIANDDAHLLLTHEYIPVKINFAEQRELATRLGVYRGGTVVVYDSRGQALGQVQDAVSAQDFMKHLSELSRSR